MRCFRTNCGRSYTSIAFNAFKWTTIQCPKQLTSDGISCGYYVGCYIEDLLRSAETSIGVNFTRPHKLKFYSLTKWFASRIIGQGTCTTDFSKANC
ncbi:hypothetical protein OROGR_024399 [Orobanche gracilis]